jgi:hypothetical protein
MLFHVFPEEGGIGETELVADLLDAVVGLLQVVADVLNDMFRYPFVSGLPGILLADGREVFGRYAEF